MIPAPPPLVATDAFVHVSTSFEFMIDAPLARAAPLFGPEGERVWGGKAWDPHFAYPRPAKDIQGAVFTVRHADLESIWINTVFDLAAGRMQYVSVVPGVMANVIDVELSSVGPRTHARVTYTRTALRVSANEHVRTLAAHDAASGPEWQSSITRALGHAGEPGASKP